MRHKFTTYIYLCLTVTLFIFSCSDEEYRKQNHQLYYSISAKDSGRIAYYEQMHRQSSNAEHWRSLDQKTKVRIRKTEQNIGTWHEIGSINHAGRVHTLDFDSTTNTVYAASAGGHIWKKKLNDEGAWTCINNHYRIPDIIFVKHLNSTLGEVFFVASGAQSFDGFFVSNNQGQSWIKAEGLEAIKNDGYIKRVLVENSADPFLLLLAEYYSDGQAYTAVFFSNDLGYTFKEISKNVGNAQYADIFINLQNEIFATIESSVYQMDTLGMQNLRGIIRPLRIGSLILSGNPNGGADDLIIAVFAENQTDFYAYRSNGVYEFISYIPENPFMINSITHSLGNESLIYFGGVNFYFSVNNGQSWTKVSDWTEYYQNIKQKFHADIPAIKSFASKNGELIFTATDGGIYVSGSELTQIENISMDGLNINQYYSSLSSNRRNASAIFGSQDQGLQKTDSLQPKQLNVIKQILAGDFGHLVSNNDVLDYWAVYPGFVMFSGNPDIRYYFNKAAALWLPPIAQYPGRNYSVWMAGGAFQTQSGNYLAELSFEISDIKSRTLAYNFASVNSELISAIAVSPFNDKVLFVSTNLGRFFRSNDGGISWRISNWNPGPAGQYFYGAKILCSSQTDSLLFWAGSAYESGLSAIYVSENSGLDFKPLASNMPKTLITGLALSNNDSILFAASEIGAFAYFFRTNQWISLQDSILPDAIFWNVEFIEQQNVARFTTFGRGIWDFEINESLHVFKPIVYQYIPDILINTTDTLIILDLEGYFYHSGGLGLNFDLHNENPILCEADISNNKLMVKSLLKGEGTISIKATDAMGNSITDNFLFKTNYTAPLPIEKSFSIKAFPNPARNEINLSGFNSFNSYDLKIFNLSGVLVKSQSIFYTPYTAVVVSDLDAGTYFLHINSLDYVDKTRVKFVKVK
jgi:hypothetical protein